MSISAVRVSSWAVVFVAVAVIVNEFYPFQLVGKAVVHESGQYYVKAVNGDFPERLAHGVMVTSATFPIFSSGNYFLTIGFDEIDDLEEAKNDVVIEVSLERGVSYRLVSSESGGVALAAEQDRTRRGR